MNQGMGGENAGRGGIFGLFDPAVEEAENNDKNDEYQNSG
jgi:hypothetical protein